MSIRIAPRQIGLGLAIVAALAAGSGGVPARVDVSPGEIILPEPAGDLRPGWTLSVVQVMPEEVSAFAVPAPTGSNSDRFLYVGTTGTGGVYRMNTVTTKPGVYQTIAQGMGDTYQFGLCCVNSLALHDLDHDGTAELLASTSQVLPRGRPRLYYWTTTNPPLLRGVVRPEIESSWGHGIGILPARDGGADSAFVTFCGFGEVVEYQPVRDRTGSGFTLEALSWKRVGQLPASGEHALVADADNDGQPDLCLATGYAPRRAALHVCATVGRGERVRPRHVIDEGGRFGNVRFLVGPSGPDGRNELFTWWCTGVADGACEFIRYRLGPEGVQERRVLGQGDADALWPRDGQMALADLDGDGRAEVWFATNSGNLWRQDGPDSTPTRVLHLDAGLGPVIPGQKDVSRPCLFLGSGRHIWTLEAA